MPDPEIPPVVVPPAADATAVLRAELEALKTSFAAEKTARETAETKATTLEREKMTDSERVAAELKEAREKAEALPAVRDELGRYTQAFENLYKAELETVPEAARPMVEILSKSGSWPDRVEALRAAKALAGVATAAAPMGASISPGAKSGAGAAPPAFDPKNPPRLSEYSFKR